MTTQLLASKKQNKPKKNPPAERPDGTTDADWRPANYHAEFKQALKNLSLPIYDGTYSFAVYKNSLEKYFEIANPTRRVKSALFLESMRKGKKEAQQFFQEVIDTDARYLPYERLITKAEEFFAKPMKPNECPSYQYRHRSFCK